MEKAVLKQSETSSMMRRIFWRFEILWTVFSSRKCSKPRPYLTCIKRQNLSAPRLNLSVSIFLKYLLYGKGKGSPTALHWRGLIVIIKIAEYGLTSSIKQVSLTNNLVCWDQRVGLRQWLLRTEIKTKLKRRRSYGDKKNFFTWVGNAAAMV